MKVTLQLLLGIFLAVSLYSDAKTLHNRYARDTIFPLQLSNQNGSEKINNRDVNKIKIDVPKIEDDVRNSRIKNVDSSTENLKVQTKYLKKVAPASDLTSNEKVETDNNSTQNVKDDNLILKSVEENKTAKLKKEDKKKNDVEKEIDRLETGRSIDSDTSKFWSSDFHNKNNVFTLSSSGNNQKFFHDDEDDTLLEPNFPGTTFSVDVVINEDLTTPRHDFFDEKYKEAVDSIEQNLDIDNEEETEHTRDVDENLNEFKLDDLINNPKNGTLEYVKTKSVIRNESTNKNSHQKDVDVEETKTVSFEKVYNDTNTYDSTLNQPKDTMSQVGEITSSTTNKNLLNEDSDKSSNNYVLSNKIETQNIKLTTVAPTLTSTTIKNVESDSFKNVNLGSSTFKKNLLEPIEHNIIPLQLSDTEKDQKGSFSDSNLAVEKFSEPPVQPTTIKIPENNSEKSPVVSVSTENIQINDRDVVKDDLTTEYNKNAITELLTTEPVIKSTTSTEALKKNEEINTTTVILDSTSTTFPETTTDIAQTTQNDVIINNETINEDMHPTEASTTYFETTTNLFPENSREFVFDKTTTENDKLLRTTVKEDLIVENVSSTTEPLITTNRFDTTHNTTTTLSDNLENETTEINRMETTSFKNIETTFLNSFDKMTTINVDITTEKIRTTENLISQETTTVLFTTVKNVTESLPLTEAPTTTILSTTDIDKNSSQNTTDSQTTTTVIENITETSEQPITTTEFAFVHIKNQDENHTTIVPDTLGPNLTYSTSKVESSIEQGTNKVVINPRKLDVKNSTEVTPTTEQESTDQAPTEELTTNDGSSKGTIAAIAISCVGALCLVLLGVLLYVMRKRQKRFKYGPRCTPVSLDEYSIDNLSVYNSVRRKGNARMSKRSFGNPAFEDPSGVTHPLNFPALSKFATNTEDINAEFEDIPQIHARTSELPEGCDSKNRYANVIPLPETRVFLKPIDGVPNSDYINANYVTGSKNIRGYYIATQGPMQNTVEDFWRMIWEQQAKVILMLTHFVENGLEKCVDYLPESEVVDNHRLFGDFQVTLKKREVKDKYIISSLQLKNMVSNSWREVTHFWYLGWPEKGVPSEANSLIAFLIEARSYMKTATIDKRNEAQSNSTVQNGGPSIEHNPVVVHCSPGTGRTGVVIASDIAIRDFETTRLVDIPKILYRIRRDRANSVQSKEQYQFIYKVVSLYATKLTGGQFLKE